MGLQREALGKKDQEIMDLKSSLEGDVEYYVFISSNKHIVHKDSEIFILISYLYNWIYRETRRD